LLSPSYSSFAFSLSATIVPKTIHETIDHPWRWQAMIDEMQVLVSNNTWELVPLLSGKKTIGCRRVYAIKVGLRGEVDCRKTQLVTKEYTQIYGFDQCDTFPPMTKTRIIRLFLTVVVIHHWSLHQLHIKMFFFMVILRRKFTWSNLLQLLLRRSLVCKLECSLYGL